MTNTNSSLFETEEDKYVDHEDRYVNGEYTDDEVVGKPLQVARTNTSVVAHASSVQSIINKNVMTHLKNSFHVSYDSPPAITASQGCFSLKSDGSDIGGEIRIDLMSYQDSYVVSPNDSKAGIELVQYSDDGITSTTGINLQEHLAYLRESGYTKAKLSHRIILVGELTYSSDPCELVSKLVQINLPDSGRKAFNDYALQASYAVSKGRKSFEDAVQITLKTVPKKNKNGDKYTGVVIS